MALQFNPPDWLIKDYMDRKNPGQQVLDSANQAASTYLAYKNQQQQQQNSQAKNVIELLGTDPELAKTPFGQKIIKQSGADLGDYQPPSISTGTTPASTTPAQPTPMDAQNNPIMGPPQGPTLPGTTLSSPIIDHWNNTMGQTADASSPAMPDAAAIQALSGRGKLGKQAIDEYKKSLEMQEIQKRLNAPPKPEDKYYTTDQANKLLSGNPGAAAVIGSFEKDKVPRDAVHLLMGQQKTSESQGNVTFIGNDKDGNPLLMNKTGKISVGSVPGSSPVLPKNSTQPTATTRSSAEFAKTVLPHIQQMRDLVKQADEKGYIGPVAGRVYNEFMAGKVGTTGNPDADKLLGRLRATDSLLKTGAMKAHFGARGGSQMYDHFSDLLNSGKQSAPMLNGALDTLENFMQGYADAGTPGGGSSSSATGPHGPTVRQNGHTYNWNPQTKQYE